jgi:2-polyprenyl-3-methyl-5-hydroxy-6-metoxy-1,4-benzoquinol methylase
MNMELLKEEGLRQGEGYSRKVVTEYDTLFGSDHWDYVRSARARWMIDFAERLIPETAGPWNVLEIGCGIGFTTIETAKFARSRLKRIIALDVSNEALKIANRMLSETKDGQADMISFREENFFLHEGGPYHLIFMHEVFEHIPDATAIFEKCRTLLAPGGLFMISTPNFDRLSNRYVSMRGAPKDLIDPYHIKEYTVAELRKPGKGWEVVTVTGRQLVDGIFLEKILRAVFRGFMWNAFKKASDLFTSRHLCYRIGGLAPSLSSELLALYRKV